MIPKQELLDLATDFGLQPNVVEKDYALGWMLAAFGEHAETRDTWLFKGGTCLKQRIKGVRLDYFPKTCIGLPLALPTHTPTV